MRYEVSKDGTVFFIHHGQIFTKPADMSFPVVVEVFRNGWGIREATDEDHAERARMAWRGEWSRKNEIGRKSEIKWGIFEWTHATKNRLIEWFRSEGIWNRKGRDPQKPDGYVFYADQ